MYTSSNLIWRTIAATVVLSGLGFQRSYSKGIGRSDVDNDVEALPVLPMDASAGNQPTGKEAGTGDSFTITTEGDTKERLVFRLSNRLAVAVCDTYDHYLYTGKPSSGLIRYNATVQHLRSQAPPSTCQSFKIKRCIDSTTDPNCGWSKVPSC